MEEGSAIANRLRSRKRKHEVDEASSQGGREVAGRSSGDGRGDEVHNMRPTNRNPAKRRKLNHDAMAAGDATGEMSNAASALPTTPASARPIPIELIPLNPRPARRSETPTRTRTANRSEATDTASASAGTDRNIGLSNIRPSTSNRPRPMFTTPRQLRSNTAVLTLEDRLNMRHAAAFGTGNSGRRSENATRSREAYDDVNEAHADVLLNSLSTELNTAISSALSNIRAPSSSASRRGPSTPVNPRPLRPDTPVPEHFGAEVTRRPRVAAVYMDGGYYLTATDDATMNSPTDRDPAGALPTTPASARPIPIELIPLNPRSSRLRGFGRENPDFVERMEQVLQIMRMVMTFEISQGHIPALGLSQTDIARLPTKVFNVAEGTNSSQTQCFVCLADYLVGDRLRILSACSHEFHSGCVDKWLETSASCPICRAAVTVPRARRSL